MKVIEKNGARIPLEPGTSYDITSPMGERTLKGAKQWHEGIDISVSVGTPVLAVESGEIVRVFSGCTESEGPGGGYGYGNHVIIKHPGNVYSLVAHNSDVFAREGDTVECGDKIASSGNTGHSSGAHIHFELVQGTDSDTWQDHWKTTRSLNGTNKLDRIDPEKYKWS